MFHYRSKGSYSFGQCKYYANKINSWRLRRIIKFALPLQLKNFVNFQIKDYINREIYRHKEEETVTHVLYKHVISSIVISLTLRKLKRDKLKSRTRIMNGHQQSYVTHQWFNTMLTILCNH